MSKVLIIGGSHFVGGHLGNYLMKKKHDIDVISKNKHNFKGYNMTAVCDRSNRAEMEKYIKDGKYEYIFDINAYDDREVEIVADLVDKDVLKKYIVLTGAAVYKPSSGITREDYEKGLNENWGHMGMRKLGIERFMEQSDLPYIILRPTYVYGPDNSMYRECYFFDRIASNLTIPVPTGQHTKKVNNQFIYVEDFVRVIYSAMKTSHVREAYNVTNPQKITWDEMIEMCGEIVGNKPIIKYVDMKKVSFRERTFFPFRNIDFTVDIDKLIEHGLHIPNTLLIEGLEKTYEWYKKAKPKMSDVKMVNVDRAINS